MLEKVHFVFAAFKCFDTSRFLSLYVFLEDEGCKCCKFVKCGLLWGGGAPLRKNIDLRYVWNNAFCAFRIWVFLIQLEA